MEHRSLIKAILGVLSALSLGLGQAGLVHGQTSFEIEPFEAEVVRLINLEREALGAGPLRPDAALFAAADGHLRWMLATRRFSHTGLGGSRSAERIRDAGYPAERSGETLARGQASPEEVVRGRTCDYFCSTRCDETLRCDGWMQSPSHRSILVDPGYRDIGVGHGTSFGWPAHWWVVDFGSSQQRGTSIEPSPTASPSQSPASPTSTPPSATPRPTATASPAPASPTPPAASPRPLDPTLTPAAASPTTPASATRLPSATASPTAIPLATGLPPSSTPIPPTATRSASPTATAVGFGTIAGRVLLQGQSAGGGGAFVAVNGQLMAIASRNGLFEISGIPAGPVKVEAYRPGWLISRGEAQLAPDQRLDIGPTLLRAGDIQLDLMIDRNDRMLMEYSVGSCSGATRFNATADFDGDGCVDAEDAALLISNLGWMGASGWGVGSE